MEGSGGNQHHEGINCACSDLSDKNLPHFEDRGTHLLQKLLLLLEYNRFVALAPIFKVSHKLMGLERIKND